MHSPPLCRPRPTRRQPTTLTPTRPPPRQAAVDLARPPTLATDSPLSREDFNAAAKTFLAASVASWTAPLVQKKRLAREVRWRDRAGAEGQQAPDSTSAASQPLGPAPAQMLEEAQSPAHAGRLASANWTEDKAMSNLVKRQKRATRSGAGTSA